MKTKLTLLLAALVLSGCALQQSSSRITYGPVTLALPKDSEFEALELTAPVALTNGTTGELHLTITKGKFKMNPAVIDRAAAHDIGLMNAGGQLVIEAAGLAAPKP